MGVVLSGFHQGSNSNGTGYITSRCKNSRSAEAVQSDDVAKAVLAMSDETHSVVMPKLPEMVSFWPAMDALINDTYKGKIAPDQYQAKLDKFVEDISKEAK